MTMIVKVRLFGPLIRKFPRYDPEKGLEVELPEGASVNDLLAQLSLGERNRPVVAVDSLIRNPEDELSEGAVVHVFLPVYGG